MSTSFSRRLACGAVAALLTLGCAHAHAQAPTPQQAPAMKPVPANLVVYLDGRRVDKATLDKTTPADLVSYMQVLKPFQAQQLFQVNAPTIIVTTKANANSPEVLAFNKRVAEVVPLVPATPAQARGIAAAQAYLAQRYPAAKVEAIGPVPNKENRYQATYTENGQRWQLFFDGDGNVVPQ